MVARTLRPTFWIKVALAAGLVAAANGLVFGSEPGGNLGMITLVFALAAALAHPAVWRSRLGLPALFVAVALGLIQIERASIMGWLLFWTALGVAVLAPRAGAADGAWQWGQRLTVLGVGGLVAPIRDLVRVLKARERGRRLKAQLVLLTLALPLIGGVGFFWLFAVANPVIGQWVNALRLPSPDIGRIVFSGFAGLLAWGTLWPTAMRRPWRTPEAVGELNLPGVTTASITLSLVVFNALFALQNGLDIAFLWRGAALPDGMTLAQYAHRGAYPLIATALLAGLFVVLFLRPGSATAGSPVVRRLVVVWIVQNLFLVASTALRTLDYVDAYSLTRLRIAALLWMGLVAVGLALIGWRLIRGKSSSWLINANALAVAVVLAACSVVDLGAVAASWNVRHAREVGGRGAPLDVCYLAEVGEPALVSLARLEREPLAPELRDRVTAARRLIAARMLDHQADWRSWQWRSARRLARARELTASDRFWTHPWADGRRCAGSQPVGSRPLTPSQNPGT